MQWPARRNRTSDEAFRARSLSTAKTIPRWKAGKRERNQGDRIGQALWVVGRSTN